MTLTEQWKKGELPLGMYYVKTPFGVEIHSDYSLYRYKLTRDVDSIEVLAPVPSYEEWQQLHKFLEEFNALDVAKENQQLKELLNYIRDEIADMPATALQLGYGWISEAAYRIDNAIGADNDKK